jgi:hypothetical protein
MLTKSHNVLEDDENRPFLPDDPISTHDEGFNAQKKLRIRLIIILFSMILGVEIGFAMQGAPATRIFEAITCQQYYEKHDKSKIGADGQIPEELCKNTEIQGEVAIVKGYGELFDALMGM